jgi:hypothetical protein
MDAQKESLTKAFFASLDSSFVNLEKEKHPLVYSTKDFTVQMKFDLPIPTLPGSIVKYCKYVPCKRRCPVDSYTKSPSSA